jgi:cobalt-precorrin 5A hydrolase
MNAAPTIALVAVTRRGLEMARLLRRRLRAGEVHRPERYGPVEHGWEVPFGGALSERVPEWFGRCGQIVFFLAAGAVTRLIAGCLGSKETDPGVLAVDEAGHFVIPLLSGHKGGANAFARTVAGCLGATPVVTTASDIVGGLSLDLLEDAFGWTATPRERLKPAARALVDGEPLAIIQEVGSAGSWLDEMDLPANVTAVCDPTALAGRSFAHVLWITDRLVADKGGIGEESILWYRPRSLVLGLGCERGLGAAALEDGLDRFLREHGFSRDSIGTLASVELKADEPGLLEVANRHGWQTVFYPAEELAAVAGVPNPSEVVARCVGTPGVAEPAALLAAFPSLALRACAAGAERLLVEKQVVTSALAPQRMTFALARLAAFEAPGPRVPGKVVFVGAGPGDPNLLTLKGRHALAGAEVVVYAGGPAQLRPPDPGRGDGAPHGRRAGRQAGNPPALRRHQPLQRHCGADDASGRDGHRLRGRPGRQLLPGGGGRPRGGIDPARGDADDHPHSRRGADADARGRDAGGPGPPPGHPLHLPQRPPRGRGAGTAPDRLPAGNPDRHPLPRLLAG